MEHKRSIPLKEIIFSMPSQKFRKLDIDLPRHHSFDQRPWLTAGLLLAFIILLMSAYAYFGSMKKGVSPAQQKENVSLKN